MRELLRRTLLDQAIRVSLSSFEGARIYGKARATAALRAYDEYLFNRMCTADENNLNWLKAEVARNGWFDIPRYGTAADNAAWLMVQHADGDPDYQLYIASVLAAKARSGETNAQNFAHLSDRIAVRVGLPQKYATQMECVDGEWLAPERGCSRGTRRASRRDGSTAVSRTGRAAQEPALRQTEAVTAAVGAQCSRCLANDILSSTPSNTADSTKVMCTMTYHMILSFSVFSTFTNTLSR